MFRIRPQSHESLRRASRQQFEDEVLCHLKAFSPLHASTLGDAGVLDVVRLGFERAQDHGFDRRGPVRLYVDMMFLFGSYFDTDPQLPWAHEILHEPGGDQNTRAHRLHARAVQYVDEVVGAGSKNAIRALRKFIALDLDSVIPPTASIEEAASRALEKAYPEKCAYWGDASLRAAIRGGMDAAQRHASQGLRANRDTALFIGLSFALGHGFEADPLVPWIAKILNDPSAEATRKLSRLHDVTWAYLETSLDALEKRAAR